MYCKSNICISYSFEHEAIFSNLGWSTFENINYENKEKSWKSFSLYFFKKRGGEIMLKKFFLAVVLLKVLYCNAVSKKEIVNCNSADVEKFEENRKSKENNYTKSTFDV